MAESVRKSCSRSSSQKLEFLRVLVPHPFAKLRIPGQIANSLQNEPHKRATLHVDGKFWHVGIHREGDDMYLDEGWKEFAAALHLRTGYFVLFQYKVNMVFSVKIFDNTMCLKKYVPDPSKKRSIHDLYDDAVQTVGVPSTKDNIYCSIHSSCKRNKLGRSHIVNRNNGMEKIYGRINKKIVKANSISPYFPRFIKIIKASHSYSNCLEIPNDFCMKHGLLSESELFLVNTTGKSWPVTLCDGKLSGFRDFARDNGLRKGDRCTFQLVNKNTFLVRVIVSGSEKQDCSPISVQNNNDLINGPEFERVVTRCYLHNMYIPLGVRTSIGLVSDCDVVLMNHEGRSWPVEFFFKANGEGHLGFGWGKFRRENNIKEGDRCIFKLVEKNVLLVNMVHRENTDTSCKEIHNPTQKPNKKIVGAKDYLEPGSVLLALKAVPKNAISLSIEKAPCIEAQEQMVQNTTNGSSSTGIERIPANDQENSSIVYVDKTPFSGAQKEQLQNINSLSSTGTKVPEAQKKLITVCVEKTPHIVAQKEIGQNDSDILCLSGIENELIVEQKKSSLFCVAKTPSSDAQKEIIEKRRKSLRLPCVEKKRLLIEMQKGQQKMDDWGSTRFPKIEKMIMPYNVNDNKMVLSKEFCERADLCSPCNLILKDSEGKTWRVKYHPNNGRGSLKWEQFVNDKKLKTGDKCIFKLVAHDTLLVNVVRK